MGNRFGRNQKRRMRQEIADLKEAYNRECKLLANMSSSLSDLREEIHDAKTILSHNSIAFKPSDVRVNNCYNNTFRYPQSEVFDSMFISDSTKIESLTFTNVDLPVMAAFVDTDKFTNNKHFMVRYGNRKYGYAISEQALKMMPKEHMIKTVSHAIAQSIFNELKNEN